MDSKYALLSNNGSNGKILNNSSKLSLKRKFSYGTSNGSPLAKKPNLQTTPRPATETAKQNAASNGNANGNEKTTNSIQLQRKQLPVFAVRSS